ncbi:hypothetical protein SAMN05216258_102424 [Albimonas pacifica]|uniref:Uncharacterized protein n=1 Tax=Albimonas pacifica TaxID=1114924 RepID=A0A1I3D7K2_9RHOB|nr:hypothetical protein SAMN05216258_102424 [Albimonas pacifica]
MSRAARRGPAPGRGGSAAAIAPAANETEDGG